MATASRHFSAERLRPTLDPTQCRPPCDNTNTKALALCTSGSPLIPIHSDTRTNDPMSVEVPTCNICGSSIFKPGYNGRLSTTKKNPSCVICGSAERHRIIYGIYASLPKEWFANARLLKIGKDNSISENWFHGCDISGPGLAMDVDLEKIGLPDGSYDWISCNHQLQKVRDDARAVAELLRVINAKGVLQICVPSPAVKEITDDWGFPDPKVAGHYRTYGKDLFDRLAHVLSGRAVFACTATDPVTGVEDVVYFVTANPGITQFFSENAQFRKITPRILTGQTTLPVGQDDVMPIDKQLSLTSKQELSRWFHEHQDFVKFREDMQGYSEADFMNSNLKLVQDLAVCDFIRKFVPKGSKVLEIGGGHSRILSFFKDRIEGWNLDKFEGVGNGPLQVKDSEKYHVVPNYIGSFDKRLADRSFDLVFSISVLEHINEPDGVLQKIVQDIDRLLKPGGYSLHCIDCRFPPGKPENLDARKMAKHIIKQYGFDPQVVVAKSKNPEVFYMSAAAYDRFWKKACNNRSYVQDGLPFNILLIRRANSL